MWAESWADDDQALAGFLRRLFIIFTSHIIMHKSEWWWARLIVVIDR